VRRGSSRKTFDRLDAAIDHATDAVPAAHAVADIVRGRLAKLRSTA
jgi:hypothetical protein